MSDPETVTLDQIRQALFAMGVEPDISNVRTIHVDPEWLTITRFDLNEHGKPFVAPSGDEMALVKSKIRVVGQ